jgi:hypothetical protein
MAFTCTLCDYSTENQGNFSHHKKTKKHILKMSSTKENNVLYSTDATIQHKTSDINATTKNTKNYVCKNCNNVYLHHSSYYRHKKTCLNNNSDISKVTSKNNVDENINLEKELFETKLKLEYSEKEKELIMKMKEEQQILLNNFMHSANKIITKEQDNNKVTTDALKNVSMSALKYANEKFKNTPALLPLDNFNLNDLDFDDEEDKKKLVEILIYNAKQNSLDKLLGDHIVKEYKKDNPEDQVFHTTDCSRLNYIVRELIETALIWSTDKSGIKICTSIIKPLIKKCINALLEHQKYLLQEMGRGEYQVQKDVEIIINVLMTIESGNLETEINKYIAPFFNLDKK